MDDAATDHIMSLPWASALVADPKWTHTRMPSRLPKPSGEDSLFAETLSTDRTLRTCLTLRPTEETDDKLVYREVVVIVDLGTGLNGYPQILHGGIAATLLDEVCGALIVLNMERMSEKLRESGAQNQVLNMNYMTACKFTKRV